MRKYILIIIAFFSWSSAVLAQEQQNAAFFTPQEIDGQIIYPSRFIEPEKKFFYHLEYLKVKINPAWQNQNYYFEIWNDHNRPIARYQAQKLSDSLIDLTNIDASQTKAIRIVIFVPKGKALPALSWPAQFIWQSYFDWRLLTVIIFITILISLILIISIWKKIKYRDILLNIKLLSQDQNQRGEENNLKKIISLIWIIFIFSGIYGLALGYFVGGLQMLYVLIKLPLLFISALLISFLTSYLLNLLLSSKQSAATVLINALSCLAITSLCLASLAPVLWFMIIVPNKHDVIVLLNVLFFGIAGLMGAIFFYRSSRRKKIGFLIWLFLYGVVALQLAWLLRPWVGLLDNVDQYIPFLRLYDGNVFVEIFNIIKRIGSDRTI